MNWLMFAVKAPMLIHDTVQIVEKIKGAKGPQKKQAVVAAVDDAMATVEFAVGHDVFNDPAVRNLRDAAIEAEVAAMKARTALQDGLMAKAPAA